MKWIKHDTNANQDAKLKRMRMKYGLEGYGLYWYCLELIAADVDQNKLTFELEHDAEIIAFDTGIHYERVNEMMAYMVNLKLFESNNGILTCLKLANRLDKSMTSNPMMRKMLGDIKVNHDAVMTQSAEPMQDKTKLDETKQDKTILNNTTVTVVTEKKVRVTKSDTWKRFYEEYPEERRGGSDATPWKKAKQKKLTEPDFVDMLEDVINRKANHEQWLTNNGQFINGITKYIEEEIWKTPIRKAGIDTGYASAHASYERLMDTDW